MNKTVSAIFSIPESCHSDIIDLRDLEAPEPMERILVACAQLEPGGFLLAQLPHVPTPLFPHLRTRGMEWQVAEESDGSAIVMIRRNA